MQINKNQNSRYKKTNPSKLKRGLKLQADFNTNKSGRPKPAGKNS